MSALSGPSVGTCSMTLSSVGWFSKSEKELATTNLSGNLQISTYMRFRLWTMSLKPKLLPNTIQLPILQQPGVHEVLRALDGPTQSKRHFTNKTLLETCLVQLGSQRPPVPGILQNEHLRFGVHGAGKLKRASVTSTHPLGWENSLWGACDSHVDWVA